MLIVFLYYQSSKLGWSADAPLGHSAPSPMESSPILGYIAPESILWHEPSLMSREFRSKGQVRPPTKMAHGSPCQIPQMVHTLENRENGHFES